MQHSDMQGAMLPEVLALEGVWRPGQIPYPHTPLLRPAARRPLHVLDSNATLLGHLLEGLRPANRFFDVADALIRETSKHNKFSHRNLLYGPPSIAAMVGAGGRYTSTSISVPITRTL